MPNLGNFSPYELTFGRKPKLLLNVDSNPDLKVSGNIKEYYELLNKRIKYLQDILFNSKSWRLAVINKNRENFQYKGRDLVYIISPITSQLRTNSQKIAIKYVGPVVVYKIVDPHNYLLTLSLPHATIVMLSDLVEKVPLQELFSAQSLARVWYDRFSR